MAIYIPLILYFIVFPLGMYVYFCRKQQANSESQTKKPAPEVRRSPAHAAVPRTAPVEVRESGD